MKKTLPHLCMFYCQLAAALLCIVLGSSTFNTADAAGEPGVPMVRGATIRDFARLTFDWPEKVKFSAKRSGSKLILSFDRAANPDTGRLLKEMHPYITRADRSKDGKTLTLTMNKPYNVRTFLSGTSTGVDLMGIDKTDAAKKQDKKEDKPKVQKQEAKKEPGVKKPPAEKPKKEEAKKTPAPAVKPQEDLKAAAKQAAKEKPAEPVKPVEKVEAPTTVDLPALPEKAAQPATAQTPAAAPAPPPATDAEGLAAAAAVQQAATPAPAKTASTTPKTAAVYSAPSASETQLVFPWNVPVGAAVFIREPYLWVVFDKPSQVDFSTFGTSEHILKAEQLPNTQFTVLRFQLAGAPQINVVKHEAPPDWTVQFTNRTQLAPRRLLPRVQQDSGATRMAVSVEGASAPLTIADPEIGDELVVVPLSSPGQAVQALRHFIDFSLLPTVQGFVLAKQADGVTANVSPTQILVESGDGLHISPQFTLEEQRPPEPATGTLFPYLEWKQDNAKAYNEREQILMGETQSLDPDQANRARLKLAQLYLAQGLATETLGMLETIAQSDPVFFAEQKLDALRGAANFLLFRLPEAQTNFSAPALDGLPEITMWRNLLGEMLGAGNEPFDYTAHASLISQYPPTLRQKISIIAADNAINRGKYDVAMAIFDSLNKDQQMDEIRKYVDFMLATISARTGQVPAAMEIWKKMAEDTSDRYLRARAEYAMVTLLLEQGKITRQEAIERLDKLRIVWRGDTLEVSLLNLLGNLYQEDRNYAEALRVLREIVTNFPNTQEAVSAAQQMATIFVELFNNGEADQMKPLDALALYYEFRELTPIGPAGDIMIRNLADRLVQVDLLDRAAALLNHQVRFRLEKEERSRVGARLALIYLLNHQPQQALDTLQMTGYGGNPPTLQMTRNRLAAQALMDLGRYENAAMLLDTDDTEESQELKLENAWRAKNWREVITIAEDLLGNRPSLTAPLNEKETQDLLKLGLAYVFEGDRVQLQYLRDYFTPLLEGNPKKDAFLYITDLSNPIDHRNMAQLSSDITRMQNFIQKYEAQVRKDGVSTVIN